MYGYVYETTCILNGKKYIGMHKWDKENIDHNYFGSGIYLKHAIEKYGKENFTCRIIEWCETRDQLSEREEYWISYYKAPINENYYNIEDGGFGGHSEYYIQPKTEKMLKALDYGRHLPASNKLKEVLSNYRKNVNVSDDTREKLRSKQIGKKAINNGEKCIYVNKEDLDEYLSNGWKIGRLQKDYTDRTEKFKNTHYSKDNTEWKKNLSNAFLGRRWVNNGMINKQIQPEELDNYLKNGFVLGRIKNKID